MLTNSQIVIRAIIGLSLFAASCAETGVYEDSVLDEKEFLVQFIEKEFEGLHDTQEGPLRIAVSFAPNQSDDLSSLERNSLRSQARSQGFELLEALEDYWDEPQVECQLELVRQPSLPVVFVDKEETLGAGGNESHTVLVEKSEFQTIHLSRPGFSSSGRVAVIRVIKDSGFWFTSATLVVYEREGGKWIPSEWDFPWVIGG